MEFLEEICSFKINQFLEIDPVVVPTLKKGSLKYRYGSQD